MFDLIILGEYWIINIFGKNYSVLEYRFKLVVTIRK